jgi:membrane associated rhomboid family serine protease
MPAYYAVLGNLMARCYLTFSMSILTLIIFTIPESKSLLAFNRVLILEHHQWWRIVTSIFAHGSVDHLTWNLITLFSSSLICEAISRKWFVCYLVAAVAGLTLFQLATYSDHTVGLGFSNVASGSFCLLLLMIFKLGLQQGNRYISMLPLIVLAAFVLHELGLLGHSTGWEMLTGRAIDGVHGKALKAGHMVGIAIGACVGIAYNVVTPRRPQN